MDPVEVEEARAALRADRPTVIARYRALEPVALIAASYGVPAGWVRARLDEWGEPRRPLYAAHLHRRAAGHVFRGRPAAPRSTAEMRAAQAEFVRLRATVIAQYEEGQSVSALAREFKVSPTWVGERLDEWDVPRRKRPSARRTL
ncbi:hypothetical protein AB0O01_24400 [Streptomyces sp. NPDC093252]|uniref:hypothetical protein n=1 Tax=Streptomyces sp. NPDC093252 TaxID=3154980 RepID=UPI0034129326